MATIFRSHINGSRYANSREKPVESFSTDTKMTKLPPWPKADPPGATAGAKYWALHCQLAGVPAPFRPFYQFASPEFRHGVGLLGN